MKWPDRGHTWMIRQAVNEAVAAVGCSPNHSIALPSKCHGREKELLLTVETEQSEEALERPGAVWEVFLQAVSVQPDGADTVGVGRWSQWKGRPNTSTGLDSSRTGSQLIWQAHRPLRLSGIS